MFFPTAPHLLPPAMPTGVPHFPPFGGPLEVQSTTPTVPPVFQQDNNTELHSQVGTTAVLHCHTEHVGENTVSSEKENIYKIFAKAFGYDTELVRRLL